MKNGSDDRRREYFAKALEGKRIPVLTLDSKWYQLLTEEAREENSDLEGQLNALLKRQGKLNNEIKEIKRLKKRLMDEIVSLMGEAGQSEENIQKTEQNRKLVEECNEKIDSYQDELLDLPREIEKLNVQLMLATMDCCYNSMKENEESIREIGEWISQIRVELKKRLIKKQEMEKKNYSIYSYMHDVFGAEVIEMFDMQHNPEDLKHES